MVVYVCALMQVHVSVGCEIYELVFRAKAVEGEVPYLLVRFYRALRLRMLCLRMYLWWVCVAILYLA